LGLIGRAARALRIENTRDFRSLEKNSTQRRMIFPVCFVLPIWSASSQTLIIFVKRPLFSTNSMKLERANF
jgi:hypothetical protein